MGLALFTARPRMRHEKTEACELAEITSQIGVFHYRSHFASAGGPVLRERLERGDDDVIRVSFNRWRSLWRAYKKSTTIWRAGKLASQMFSQQCRRVASNVSSGDDDIRKKRLAALETLELRG
jgi:hypothetical protein